MKRTGFKRPQIERKRTVHTPAPEGLAARVSMGPGIRTLSTLETAILTDLGYTMVPAPGSAAVLLLGVFFLHRRRRVVDHAIGAAGHVGLALSALLGLPGGA